MTTSLFSRKLDRGERGASAIERFGDFRGILAIINTYIVVFFL